MAQAKLKFTVLENARDFLEDTIAAANDDRKSAWKYAIISLASAIELVLKGILEKEHWSLLFANVDLASKELLAEGQFKSVDFETALVRAERIAGVKLALRDRNYITSLRNTRNQVSHFDVDLNIDKVKALVARGIIVFLELYKTPSLAAHHDKNYEARVNNALKDFDRYVRLRMASLKKQIESSNRPDGRFTWCNSCCQNAIVSLEGESNPVKCLYCGETSTLGELAVHRSDLPVELCPECSQETMAFLLYNNDEGEFVCANCGFEADSLRHCWECGSTFVGENGGTLCRDCLEYKLNKG